MQSIETRHESLRLPACSGLPSIDVRFGACRANGDAHFYDVLDFNAGTIDRWFTPPLDISAAAQKLRAQVTPGKFTGNADFFIKEMRSAHVLQVSPNGKMFVNRGNFLNGTSFTMINAVHAQASLMIEGKGEEPYFYTATGGFSPDYGRWYFMRWPVADSIAILNGEAIDADCEICWVDLNSGMVEKLATIRNPDRIHQITPSPDGRHLLFSSFKSEMRIRYPDVPLEQDPAGYRRSHEAGIIPQAVVTFDAKTGRHWHTDVPVPVSAHLEFDPLDPAVFYVSGHNFSINSQPNVIIEGSGAIIRMRIEQGNTRITGIYQPGDLYRVSQHVPFLYGGRTVLAVTNTPNKLDLVDGASMTLWRREELFPYDALDFELTGSCVSPMPGKAFFSINPSSDGRFLVMESSENFHVYSTEEACFLAVTVPRCLPPGANGTGHTRLVGH